MKKINRAPTPIRGLATWDPELAKATILHTASRHGGIRRKMARDLKVSAATLWRLVRELGLVTQVDAYRAHPKGGPKSRGVSGG